MTHPNTNIAKVLLNNDLIINDLPGSISLPRLVKPENSNWYLSVAINANSSDPKFVIGYSISAKNKTNETNEAANAINLPGYNLIERQSGNDYLFEKVLQYRGLSGFDVNFLRDELILEMFENEINNFNQLDLPANLI